MKKVFFLISFSLFLLPVLRAQSEAEMKSWQEFYDAG
jgi:hypothetical protein